MAQFTTPPVIDGFETTLAQAWNGLVGTIYVNAIPDATLSGGDKTYVVVNPGKTTQQVGRISGWTSGQLTCDSVTIKKGSGTNYSTTTHAVKSKIIITDTYQTWEDIKTAVNSKASIDSSNTRTAEQIFNGEWYPPEYTTSQRDAITWNRDGAIISNTTTGTNQQRTGGAWTDIGDTGTPNASDTVAGKSQKTTDLQVANGTATGSTGAPLFVGPDNLKVVTDAINASIPVVTNYFGFSSDGNVTISTDTTLTRDMFYGNLTINSGVTLYPNGYKIFCSGTLLNNGTISRVGNTGGAGGAGSGGNVPGSAGAAASILNQGTLNDQTSPAAGGAAGGSGGNGTSVSPAYTNTSGVSGGAGGTGGTVGGTGGTATQGSLYNTIFSRDQIIALFQSAALSLSGFYATTSYKICGTAGGGGSGTSAGGIGGGGGGGGGGHGGLIYIAANIFNNQGTINCSGGIGGAGGTGGSGGGGGGGGNGGVLFLTRKTLTNLGTVTVSGGAGGAGGGSGSGFPGSGGTTGNNGTTIQITV